ncbi:MAG: serine hydroxymethyltransferase [Candidatus Diapherotrites archaeon]|nr:serine hydroxymethyltransferase [Candidatus Diapherotrites archaeon]
MFEALRSADPEISSIIQNELDRQRNGLELIASENFPSLAVLEAMCNPMNNKYSEGYPGKRYYGGNQFIDLSEDLCRQRAKKLFNAEHANVQPHAGSQANMAAYFALLKPGQKILSIELPQGGHLTHGASFNFSGRLYNFVFYDLDPETGRIDPDAVRKKALAEKPDLVLCGYSAYPREFPFKDFGDIAAELGVPCMVDIAHIAGLVAAGVHASPFPHCDVVTTTTHKTLRGPRGGLILCREGYAKKIDNSVFPGVQGGPFDHVIAAKAVAFKEASTPEFAEYARQIVKNAKVMAARLLEHGYDLVSGGTDNHLILVDLRNKGSTGLEAEQALEAVNISVNRNAIPNDPQPPYIASGLRVGTPAMTTRGMKESEMIHATDLMHRGMSAKSESEKQSIRAEVLELCNSFPLYSGLSY